MKCIVLIHELVEKDLSVNPVNDINLKEPGKSG